MLRVSSVSTSKDHDALYNLLRADHSPVAHHIRHLGQLVAIQARLLAGLRTGALKRSINSEPGPRTPRGDYTVLVGSDVRHALVHHEGARPHRIAATQGKMLVFQGRRGRVVTHAVNHPGHPGNPYLVNALRMVVLGR